MKKLKVAGRNLLIPVLAVSMLLMGCTKTDVNETGNGDDQTQMSTPPTDAVIPAGEILVDSSGLARWNSITGSQYYVVEHMYYSECCNVFERSEKTKETQIQLNPNHRIEVRAVYSDGSLSDVMISDYYLKDDTSDKIYEYVSSLPQWDAFANIDLNSVTTNPDGSIYFETQGPGGDMVRFWGEDIEITPDGVLFHSLGRIVSLDSIGRIYMAMPSTDEPTGYGFISNFGAYNANFDPHPDDISNMIYTRPFGKPMESYKIGDELPYEFTYYYLQPNFIGLGCDSPAYTFDRVGLDEDMLVQRFIVIYEPDEECTKFDRVVLPYEDYGVYMEGDFYDVTKETWDPVHEVFNFAASVVPELHNTFGKEITDEMINAHSEYYCANAAESGMAIPGDLKDAGGKVLDKDNTLVTEGLTLSVKIGDYEGTVRTIGTFYTDLITFDNRHITLPNSTLTNTALINYTREGTRRLDVTFSVSYDSDLDTVYKTLNALVAGNDSVLPDPAPQVVLNKCGDSGLEFSIRVWVLNTEYWNVYFYLLDQGKRALDRAGIVIPYPQMDVHVKQEAVQ